MSASKNTKLILIVFSCYFVLIFCLCLSFILANCGRKVYHWDFNYDYDKIKEIKIIEMVGEVEFNVIKEIDLDLSKELYEDILNLDMHRYGTNLCELMGRCFLIVFDNGEYDIISQKEPKHFKYNGANIEAYNSWLYSSEEEFEALLNKYLAN